MLLPNNIIITAWKVICSAVILFEIDGHANYIFQVDIITYLVTGPYCVALNLVAEAEMPAGKERSFIS